MDDAAVPRHQRHGACERATLDVPLHQLGDASKALGRQPDVLGLAGRSLRAYGQREGKKNGHRDQEAE
jgi:hypothetical protein